MGPPFLLRRQQTLASSCARILRVTNLRDHQTTERYIRGNGEGKNSYYRPIVPDEVRSTWHLEFSSSKNPAERAWGDEVCIQKQTEQRSDDSDCRGDSSKEKRQK